LSRTASRSARSDARRQGNLNFENNLKKPEELVARLEAGDMKLDDMIKAFEEGRKLVDTCQKDLESIRQRIEKVTKGGAVEEMQA
jgi:exodeoxyribonuclease VII small subunit